MPLQRAKATPAWIFPPIRRVRELKRAKARPPPFLIFHFDFLIELCGLTENKKTGDSIAGTCST